MKKIGDDIYFQRNCHGYCEYCGMYSRLTRDHIYPKSSGGTNDATNVAKKMFGRKPDDIKLNIVSQLPHKAGYRRGTF